MDRSSAHSSPGLQPPRFGLSGLLIAIGLCGALFAFMHYAGLYASVIAVFVLLCVAAHIAGNAIGTRLRAIGSTPPAAEDQIHRERLGSSASARYSAPVGELGRCRSLGKPIIAITAIGAAAGAIASGYVLIKYAGSTPRLVIALGIAASSVLGAIWFFAAGSFLQVLARAWFGASHPPRKKI